MWCGKIVRLSRKINQNQWKFALMGRLALFFVPLVVKPLIGYGYSKGSRKARKLYNARVVLQKNGKGGFSILTSYPIP
jgi:hypothetical protein